MAEKSGLFNAVGGVPAYNDVDMATMFALLTGGQGYLVGKDNELEVTAGTGLQVLVGTGAAWSGEPNGWWYQNDASKSLSLDAETAGYDRIDRVILRLDRNTTALTVTAAVLKGTAAASSPVAPSLTQNSTIYELSLAQVYVTGGSTSITVTDERESLCGKVYAGWKNDYQEHTITSADGNTYSAYPMGVSYSEIDAGNVSQTGQSDNTDFPMQGMVHTINKQAWRLTQWFHAAAADDTYKRYYYGGTWYPWQRLVTEDDAEVTHVHTITSTNGNTYSAYPVGISYSIITSANYQQSNQADNADFPAAWGKVTNLQDGDVLTQRFTDSITGALYHRTISTALSCQPWRRLDSGNLSKTANFTLASSHMNCVISCYHATGLTVTIPTHASDPIPVGADITLYQSGDGAITVAPASGVTLRSEDSKRKTDGTHTAATLRKWTDNEWLLIGRLTS